MERAEALREQRKAQVWRCIRLFVLRFKATCYLAALGGCYGAGAGHFFLSFRGNGLTRARGTVDGMYDLI